MTKKFEFENPPKWSFPQNPIFHDQKFFLQKKNFGREKIGFWGKDHFGGFSNFQIQIFLSFLVSHQKNFFFLKANILLFYKKKQFKLIASIQQKTYYKR